MTKPQNDAGQGDPKDEDFRTLWQRTPFKIGLVVAIVVGLLFLLHTAGFVDWLGDRYRDVVGEARYAQLAFEEDVLEHTPIGEVHAELLPNYAQAVIRSGNPERDSRVTDALERTKRRAADDELAHLLDRIHRALLDGERDLSRLERAWNARLVELDHPYAIQGGGFEDHGHFLYMPETYRIVGTVSIDIDGITHTVEWRHRLDNFRRAADPIFYHSELDRASVRSDRGWLTLWNGMAPAILLDSELEGEDLDPDDRPQFAWRAQLRSELADHLGDEDFQALLRGALRRQKMDEIVSRIARRGNACRHNFRILRLPWLGFDSDELERFRRVGYDDRLAECPRITQDEARQLHRISRDHQSDLAYQSAMRRFLASFLIHKSIMAAAMRHRIVDDAPACRDCDDWDELDAAEIGGYLTGTLHGPLPLLGLFRLCFDHRYGSPASYRGWLLLLRDRGFECKGPLPDDLFEELQIAEDTVFSPIESISFTENPPETTPIYRRD